MDISSLLLKRGLATAEQIAAARSQSAGRRVDQVLVSQGTVSEEAVLQLIAYIQSLKGPAGPGAGSK